MVFPEGFISNLVVSKHHAGLPTAWDERIEVHSTWIMNPDGFSYRKLFNTIQAWCSVELTRHDYKTCYNLSLYYYLHFGSSIFVSPFYTAHRGLPWGSPAHVHLQWIRHCLLFWNLSSPHEAKIRAITPTSWEIKIYQGRTIGNWESCMSLQHELVRSS